MVSDARLQAVTCPYIPPSMRLRTLLSLALAAPLALTGCSESSPVSAELASPEASAQKAHIAKMESEHGVRLVATDKAQLFARMNPDDIRSPAPTSSAGPTSLTGDSDVFIHSNPPSGLKGVTLTGWTSYSGRNQAEYGVTSSLRNVGANNSCNNTPQEFTVINADGYGFGGTATAAQDAFYVGKVKWAVVSNHYALVVGGSGPFSTSDTLCY